MHRMLPGIVAIDVPHQTPIEWADAATQACTAALGEGRCVRETDAVEAVWHARVFMDETSPLVLRVELRASANAEVSTRVLEFRDVDPDRQRWASAGVVVAALVSAREAGAPAEALEPSHTEPAAPRAEAAPPTPIRLAPAQSASRLWGDFGFVVLRVTEEGPWVPGGRFDVAFRPLDAPWLVSLNGTGAWTTEPFRGRWLSLGIGTGVRLVEVPAWEVGARFGVEEVEARASRVRDGLLEHAERARLRLLWAAESRLAVPLVGPLAGVAGVEAGWHSAEVQVNFEGRRLGGVPPFSFGMELALRWVFLP